MSARQLGRWYWSRKRSLWSIASISQAQPGESSGPSSSTTRPLVRFLPRSLAMIVTFAGCGFFLHDIPAWVFTLRCFLLERR